MNPLFQVLKLAFFLLALWLAINNLSPVELRLSSRLSISLPLIAMLLACVFIGATASALALAPRLFRMRRALQAAASFRVAADETNGPSSGGTSSAESNKKRAKKAAPAFTGERIVDAARNIGAVGELDPDTRFRR